MNTSTLSNMTHVTKNGCLCAILSNTFTCDLTLKSFSNKPLPATKYKPAFKPMFLQPGHVQLYPNNPPIGYRKVIDSTGRILTVKVSNLSVIGA